LKACGGTREPALQELQKSEPSGRLALPTQASGARLPSSACRGHLGPACPWRGSFLAQRNEPSSPPPCRYVATCCSFAPGRRSSAAGHRFGWRAAVTDLTQHLPVSGCNAVARGDVADLPQAQQSSYVVKAANDEVAAIVKLKAAGARYIIIPNLANSFGPFAGKFPLPPALPWHTAAL